MYSSIHREFSVKECGFFIHNIHHPFMGASLDGLISCLCYGEGVCEIKIYNTIYRVYVVCAFSVHIASVISLFKKL